MVLKRWLKLLWILIASIVVLFSFFGMGAGAEVISIYLTLVLSYPTGLLIYFILTTYSGIFFLFELLGMDQFTTSIACVSLLLAGYFQWFMIFPSVWQFLVQKSRENKALILPKMNFSYFLKKPIETIVIILTFINVLFLIFIYLLEFKAKSKGIYTPNDFNYGEFSAIIFWHLALIFTPMFLTLSKSGLQKSYKHKINKFKLERFILVVLSLAGTTALTYSLWSYILKILLIMS